MNKLKKIKVPHQTSNPTLTWRKKKSGSSPSIKTGDNQGIEGSESTLTEQYGSLGVLNDKTKKHLMLGFPKQLKLFKKSNASVSDSSISAGGMFGRKSVESPLKLMAVVRRSSSMQMIREVSEVL
jgi:hypothetical protein